MSVHNGQGRMNVPVGAMHERRRRRGFGAGSIAKEGPTQHILAP
jgi:hypothetical protein